MSESENLARAGDEAGPGGDPILPESRNLSPDEHAALASSSQVSQKTGQEAFSRTQGLSYTAVLAQRLLTPRKGLLNGILRPPDTPGTGQSVRFGKRLYDDGDESRMSSCTGQSSSSHISSGASSPAAGGRTGAEQDDQSDSADIVEMSLMSIGRRDGPSRHPYSVLSANKESQRSPSETKVSEDDCSSESVGLPVMDGYSNLEDESFSIGHSSDPRRALQSTPNIDWPPYDNNNLQRQAQKLEIRRHASVTADDVQRADLPATKLDEHDADRSEAWSPMTATTQASDYRSAKSSTSPAPSMSGHILSSPDGLEKRSAQSSSLRHGPLSHDKDEMEEGTDLSRASESDSESTGSPSAHKARRRRAQLMKDQRKASQPQEGDQDSRQKQSGSSLSRVAIHNGLKQYTVASGSGPSGLVRSQTTPSFLSLSFSSESSSTSTSNRTAACLTVKEIFKATDELDRAHFERAETLLRRVQSVEREAADLRHSRARDRAVRDAQKRALEHVEELLQKLRVQLASRHLEKNGEEMSIVETIQEHLEASKTHHKALPTGSAVSNHDATSDMTLQSQNSRSESQHDQSDSRDRLEVLIRDELERDFEIERQKLRQDHEADVRKLLDQFEDVKSNGAVPHGDEEQGGVPVDGVVRTSPDQTHSSSYAQATQSLPQLQPSEYSELLELVQALEQKIDAESDRARFLDEECARLKEELQVQWRYAERSRETETQLRAQIQQLEEAATSLQHATVQKESHEVDVVAAHDEDASHASGGTLTHQLDKTSPVDGAYETNTTEPEAGSVASAELLSKLSTELEALQRDKSDMEAAYEARLHGLQQQLDVRQESARDLKQTNAQTNEEAMAHRYPELESSSIADSTLAVTSAQDTVRQDDTRLLSADEGRVCELEKRVRRMERELGDRGLTIVKLRKAKERLEADNLNFSIALSAKQQELSLIKRSRPSRGDGSETTMTPLPQSAKTRHRHLQKSRASALLQDITLNSTLNTEATAQYTPSIPRQKQAGVTNFT